MGEQGKNHEGVSPGDGGPKALGPRHPNYVPKHSPEQREKWRNKHKRRLERKQAGQVQAVAPPQGPRPAVVDQPVAPAVNAVPGTVPGVLPVAATPWTAEQTEPLWQQLLPALEKWDVETLKAAAAKVDPELVATVGRDAAWNPASRRALCIALAQVSAKWLTKSGISPENAPEVALFLSAGAIFAGRLMVVSGIQKAAAEKRSQHARSMLEKDRAGQPPSAV